MLAAAQPALKGRGGFAATGKLHLDSAPLELIVHLPQQLKTLAPDTNEWTTDLLQPLLAEFPTQTPLAVYERRPAWLYSALALHTGRQKFYQFDPRLNWIEPPILQSSTTTQPAPELIHLEPQQRGNTYALTVHLPKKYLDYSQANQLAFPEPPSQCGVIINGQLPLWLFTALARFYAQRNVLWIAINDIRINKACVISSQTPQYAIGDFTNMLE